MRAVLEALRHREGEAVGDRIDGAAGRQRDPVRDPEHMGVDGDHRLMEREVRRHLGALAADARQEAHLRRAARHRAAEVVDQGCGQLDDVTCLRGPEPDRPDDVGDRASPSARIPAGSWPAANSASAMRETVGPVDWAESSTVTSSRNGSVRRTPPSGPDRRLRGAPSRPRPARPPRGMRAPLGPWSGGVWAGGRGVCRAPCGPARVATAGPTRGGLTAPLSPAPGARPPGRRRG